VGGVGPRKGAYWQCMLVKEALTFRPCLAVDLIFIARLSSDVFAEYTTKAVSETLAVVSRHATWVALRGQESVGFVTVGKDGDVAVLHALAVVKGERGKGVGFRLMQLFERFAREQSVRRLELCSAECNLAALDLFFRRGFRLVHRRERFYERGQNACLLMKDLEVQPGF
jgi:ribosomal protein S18 acetylase RimI-like enzyme